MEAMTCTIPGEPVAYARSRHRGGQHFKPKRHREWEASAVMLLRAAWKRRGLSAPWEGPVGVRLVVVHPRPSRVPKTAGDGPLRRGTATCDLDNVVKLALDAVTKAGWVVDDRQVQAIHAERLHAAVGQGPRVELTMWRVG